MSSDPYTPSMKNTDRAHATPCNLLDTKGLAAFCGMSVPWVRKLLSAGQAPPMCRIGMGRGRLMFPLATSAAWLASRMQTPGGTNV
jgi:predicted DNA-binding transcriptional regulator AlpA